MTPTSKQREAMRREKAAALRQAEETRRRRRSRLIVTGSALGVLALVAIIAVVMGTGRFGSSGTLVQPPGVVNVSSSRSAGVYQVGRSDAPATVDLYEDFQCPACETFETQTGPTLGRLVDSGKIKVRYHVLSFIDDNVGGSYSARSANAAACVQANAPERFRAFHDALYRNQPKEGSNPPDSVLLDAARGVGVTGAAFTTCVKDRTYKTYVSRVQDEASKAGVNQTPTILLNGREMQGAERTPDGFAAAVDKAIGPAK